MKYLHVTCIIVGVISIYVESSRVLELSEKFLDVSKDGMWFVKFYAPWCGHCKKIEPIWNQVAQTLHSSHVRVGRVDCTRYASVATHFKVSGFPTILFLKGEDTYTFNGDRTREEMVEFAQRLAGPPIQHLEKYEDFLAAKKKHLLFFIYVGDADTEIREHYEELAKFFQTANYFYSALPSCLEQEFKDETWPQIFVSKDGIYKKAELDSEDVNSTLIEWVNKERFILYPKISHGNFPQLLATGKYLVIAVLEENKVSSVTPEMARFRTLLNTVATENKDYFNDMFQFGWLGQPEIANTIAMVHLPIPSLIVINSSNYQYFIPDDEPRQLTAEAIVNFLDQITNNSISAYGGNTFPVRLYRAYFEAKTSLSDMWYGNPVLTAVLFGLPLGFLSLICYSICCSDILEASDEEELIERDRRHVKKE